MTHVELRAEDIMEHELDNDPRDWNWEAAIRECLAQEPSDNFHALFIGTIMSVMPSGKYWTWFACGNVTEKEQAEDTVYQEILEECAEEAGGWIEMGLNGDFCDMFFCLPCAEPEELE